MIKYKIGVSFIAQDDIESIFDYISNSLKSSDAANRIIDRLEKKILSLSTMPDRAAVAMEKDFYNYKIRFVPVGNYDVFYFIDEVKEEVVILRVMYDKMNWREYLR